MRIDFDWGNIKACFSLAQCFFAMLGTYSRIPNVGSS